jgi:hypothetical protein
VVPKQNTRTTNKRYGQQIHMYSYLEVFQELKIGLVEDGRVVAGAGRCRCFFAFVFDWPDEGSLIVVDYDLI